MLELQIWRSVQTLTFFWPSSPTSAFLSVLLLSYKMGETENECYDAHLLFRAARNIRVICQDLQKDLNLHREGSWKTGLMNGKLEGRQQSRDPRKGAFSGSQSSKYETRRRRTSLESGCYLCKFVVNLFSYYHPWTDIDLGSTTQIARWWKSSHLTIFRGSILIRSKVHPDGFSPSRKLDRLYHRQEGPRYSSPTIFKGGSNFVQIIAHSHHFQLSSFHHEKETSSNC